MLFIQIACYLLIPDGVGLRSVLHREKNWPPKTKTFVLFDDLALRLNCHPLSPFFFGAEILFFLMKFSLLSGTICIRCNLELQGAIF